MKTEKRFAWIIALCLEGLLTSSFAQVGSDSPGGVAGGYNGQVTTGCSYDAYTGNATRAITDFVVAGGVGTYPLAFTRYANSRYAIGTDDSGNGLNADFGEGASWSHSYQWAIDATGKKKSDGKPKVFTVRYPDSRVIKFSASTNGDPYFRGGQAIVDRLQVFWDSSTAGRAYLIMPDGGKVYFTITITYSGNTGGWANYTYQVQSITDPYGQTTTITASPNLVTITEPAGRWLKLHYARFGDPTYGDSVINQVEASDGRTVQYNYTTYTDSGGGAWTVLDNVVYYGDSNLTARYTYQGVGGNPLLATCIDPMYAGAMWKIAYKFASGMNADGTTSAVPGQILSENYFDGTTVGAAVSILSVDNSTTSSPKRTETRGDGPTRTFTYSSQLLASWTDFKGAVASQAYDGNGFVKTVTDFHAAGSGGSGGNGGATGGNTTTFQRDLFTGVITQVTYPQTPTSCPSCPAGTVKYAYVSPACNGSNTCDSNNLDTNNEYYLFSATDEAGNTNYLIRDSNKRVTQKKYADTGTESFTYNSFGQVLTHRLATGGLETNTFDGRGLLTQYRDPYHLATVDPNNSSVPTSATPAVLYTYDAFDRVATITDALGSGASDLNHTSTNHYNSRGDIDTTTLPVDPIDGQRHTISKVIAPASGTVTSVTDQLGHTTSFTYDDYRRLVTTTTPPRFSGDTMNHTARVYYDVNGTGNDYTHTDARVTYAVLPSGKKTATVYDENKRKISVTAAPGTSDAATTSFGYDLNGSLISVVSPNEQPGQLFAGQSTTITYDERHRPYSVRDPLGNVTSCTYDFGGRKKTVTRSNGQLTTFDSFDAMNRLLQSTVKQTPDPDAVTKYHYLTSGLLDWMKDPHLVAINSSESYSYEYDLMGRKTQLTYPKADAVTAATNEQWTYDSGNRNDSFRNRNGNTQRTLFDNLSRPYNVSWDDSGLTPTVTLGYDVGSRATSIVNANATISHAFFDDGLLNSETTTYSDNTARTVSYIYDADANRATIQYPNNAYSFSYGYTGRNQLSDIGGAHFVYDPDGNLTTRTPGNSTTSSHNYDGLDRVTHIAHQLNGTTRTFDYAYDSVGNRKWTKRDGANGDVFGYDLTDQSVSVLLDVANPDTSSPGSQTINYDANGNRTTFSPYGTTDTYTTNNLNQYTQRNSVNAGYDTKGNMTAGFDASGYTFDAQDRILNASKAGTFETFKYDGLNRQVNRTIGRDNPNTIYNVYDGWNLIAEYSSGSTSPSTAYLGGLKILTTNRYYYQDGSGSTSHLADNTGQLLEWYRYDLQGTPIFYDALNNQLSASNYSIRHLFTGQQWYSELGLYDLRNRFYSPDIGRFLQADPISFGGDATNLYRNTGNNPVNRSDPSGEYAQINWGTNGRPSSIDIPLTIVGGTAQYKAVIGQAIAFGVGAVYGVPVNVIDCSGGCDSTQINTLVISPGSIEPNLVPDQHGENNYATIYIDKGADELAADAAEVGNFYVGIDPQTFSMPESPLKNIAVGSISIQSGRGTTTYQLITNGVNWGAYQPGVAGSIVVGGLNPYGGIQNSPQVGFSMDPNQQGDGPGPMDGLVSSRQAVGESTNAGGGYSGPTVASMPTPQMYPSGWKWYHNPFSSYGDSNQLHGWWTPTAWTTDPSLAVPMPTYKGNKRGRHGSGGPG